MNFFIYYVNVKEIESLLESKIKYVLYLYLAGMVTDVRESALSKSPSPNFSDGVRDGN